ncbi:hypothetical protein HYDPIDRAFT_34394 [Hydnomerulius pinastri MD-312]|uniref:Uncharacterized protein n=1 Tax=Hydnomerulius pinastri MD-312 TaxID=994086 RepID=A0A0C9UYX7_9AGAM|nr:hypothetical protein HYDPIDRAFT_34394 [Hydnomerulius pinastri MD-312]
MIYGHTASVSFRDRNVRASVTARVANYRAPDKSTDPLELTQRPRYVPKEATLGEDDDGDEKSVYS